MNKVNWTLLAIIFLLFCIVLLIPSKQKETIRNVNTIFRDSIKYIKLKDSIKTEIKLIEQIKYEKDKRLQYIDSISNDSVVILFYKLVEGEQSEY